jgi:hypothetical protein
MIGKETFELSKKDYSEKLSRVINNHRVNSKLVGEPRDFILRSCRLVSTWFKLSSDPEVEVYLRNVDTAGGRKVKMISLERKRTKQPVPKAKLIDSLYPPKKIATSATLEEKHYNAVKSAMRSAVDSQLKEFRASVTYPTLCYLTDKTIKKGMRTDVDHVGLSFAEIADTFVKSRCLKYTEIGLVGPPTAKRFTDPKLWSDWKKFHLEFAKFSLVLASANRSKGCGDYTTPKDLYGTFSKEDPEDLALDF